MGATTHKLVLGLVIGRMKVTTYSDNPLCSQGNSKGNPASPPHCPNTGPFHKFGGCCCGLQKERERRLAHLVGFDNCLANLVSFPPLKAVGTGQVAIVKKDYRTGQITVP